MIVRTAGDDAETAFRDGRSHGFRVSYYLFLIVPERRFHSFFQANGFGGDRVDQRAALRSGEGELVQFFGEGGFAQYQPATRPAQRFVRGGGNDVGVRNRTWVHTGGHQAGDVRHVHEEKSADGFRGFGDALEINDSRIGAR